MNFISICLISFFSLFMISISLFLMSLNFLFFDLVYFIEYELVSLNSNKVGDMDVKKWISRKNMISPIVENARRT